MPLRNEQYDLVIPREFYDSALLQPLLALIRSQAFQQQVEALGGYDVSTMGEVVADAALAIENVMIEQTNDHQRGGRLPTD